MPKRFFGNSYSYHPCNSLITLILLILVSSYNFFSLHLSNFHFYYTPEASAILSIGLSFLLPTNILFSLLKELHQRQFSKVVSFDSFGLRVE